MKKIVNTRGAAAHEAKCKKSAKKYMRLTYCVIQRVIFFVGTIRLVGDNDIFHIFCHFIP